MSKDLLIEISRGVIQGTPVFAGTRVLAKTLFDYLKAGDTLVDFLDDFPTDTPQQAVKVLELAERDLLLSAS